MADAGCSIRMHVPFRGQPVLVQIGNALVVLCIALFGLAVPLHAALYSYVLNRNFGGFGLWAILIHLAFLGAFFGFGFSITSRLIGAGYELNRPIRATWLVAAVLVLLQLAAGAVGLSKGLFLAELIGMFACGLGGWTVSALGHELNDIASGKSCGGGLGAIIGFGYGAFAGGELYALIGAILGGAAAEGVGRTLRRVVRRRSQNSGVSPRSVPDSGPRPFPAQIQAVNPSVPAARS